MLKDNYELSKLRTLGLEHEILELKGENARLRKREKAGGEEAPERATVN